MNEEYIKKLEETNKALELELVNQEKTVDHYKRLRNNLVVALATCRTLLYEYSFKDSPKRNEKADRAFEGLLADIKGDANRYEISPFDINSYEKIKKFIEEIEKSPLDKTKDTI
jgi:hypothetical protein